MIDILSVLEKITFKNYEFIYFAKFEGLQNILHWHFQHEVIKIIAGTAEISIDGKKYNAIAGDTFFCCTGQMHYIKGSLDSVIEVMIFSSEVMDESLDFVPCSSKVSDIDNVLYEIKVEIAEKKQFYLQRIKLLLSEMYINILRNQSFEKKKETVFYKEIIEKIHKEYASITFEEIVSFSGYSPAYFSRLFKEISGMTFSSYLNHVRVENAVKLLRKKKCTVTQVATICGFSTIRNFNRVFMQISKHSPTSLPDNFEMSRPVSS